MNKWGLTIINTQNIKTHFMKLLAILGFAFMMTSSAVAQQIDARLSAAYEKAELEQMLSDNPERIKLLTYALDNGVYVANGADGKGMSFPTVEVDLNNLPSFVDLGVDIIDENQYFQIAGMNKLLVVKSNWVLNYEMSKK